MYTHPQAITLVNTLTKELDIHAAMESVRQVALELLECDRVTLFLVIESRQELRCVVQRVAVCWGLRVLCGQHGGKGGGGLWSR